MTVATPLPRSVAGSWTSFDRLSERWCNLLLLLFLVLTIIIIIVIIIIIILSGVRVPLLLLALAPARFSLLSRSLCSIGHRVQLSEDLIDIKTKISRPISRENRNKCDENTMGSGADIPCLDHCGGRVEESFWLHESYPCSQ